MVSEVVGEDDLLKEVQEGKFQFPVEALYMMVAVTLANEGHTVLLNRSDPSIISDIDERGMSWTIALVVYRMEGESGWGRGLGTDILNFDTMELVEGRYRHAAIQRRQQRSPDGKYFEKTYFEVPPYCIDDNEQPVGYVQVVTENPPFYEEEKPTVPLNPDFSWEVQRYLRDIPKGWEEEIEGLWEQVQAGWKEEKERKAQGTTDEEQKGTKNKLWRYVQKMRKIGNERRLESLLEKRINQLHAISKQSPDDREKQKKIETTRKMLEARLETIKGKLPPEPPTPKQKPKPKPKIIKTDSLESSEQN